MVKGFGVSVGIDTLRGARPARASRAAVVQQVGATADFDATSSVERGDLERVDVAHRDDTNADTGRELARLRDRL